MKKMIVGVVMIALLAPFYLCAEEANQKVVAIGDVDAGYDIAGQRAYDVKETIQAGLKKEIEKKGNGKYVVNIVSPAVITKDSQPEAAELPELPSNRAPTQKEIAAYMAAMQQMQKQMTGQIKVHKPVQADAYFDFKVVSGNSAADTSGAAGTIGDLTGLNTSAGDMGTKTTKVYLVATMRDPKTGTLIDKYTAKASSVKFRNVAGYTDYNYGDDEITRERLFKSAIKDCAKWISGRLQ